MKELSDEQLYRDLRKGSRDAFAELYDRREPSLYRYVLHMTGSRVAAEDITHEVFMQVIRPDSRFDPEKGSLEAYLYGVARNLIRGMKRMIGVQPPRDRAAAHDILGDLIKSDRTAALYVALHRLPERYRDAVVLCDLEERSYEEAARLMQCPIGTVRSRLHRAHAILAESLKPVTVTAGSGAAR